jgi:hypothetical protein
VDSDVRGELFDAGLLTFRLLVDVFLLVFSDLFWRPFFPEDFLTDIRSMTPQSMMKNGRLIITRERGAQSKAGKSASPNLTPRGFPAGKRRSEQSSVGGPLPVTAYITKPAAWVRVEQT